MLFSNTGFWANPKIWVTIEENRPGAAPVVSGGPTALESTEEHCHRTCNAHVFVQDAFKIIRMVGLHGLPGHYLSLIHI